MKKLVSIIFSLLLVLVLVGTTGNNGSALAQVTDTPTPTDTASPTPTISITGSITPTIDVTPTPSEEEFDPCVTEAWGFVITEVDSEQNAPTSITILWSDNSTEVVPFAGYDTAAKAAFYFSVNNLHLEVKDMTFTGSEAWKSPYGLVFGPMLCEPTATPTPTETVDEDDNEKTTPTPTPTSAPADDKDDDAEVLGATTLPDTSSGNINMNVVTGVLGMFLGFFLIAFHFGARAGNIYSRRPSHYVIYKQV